VNPETLLERTLVAVDELTGFLTAVALVRPSKDIRDITKIKSVKEKWKDRSFAAAVNREEIAQAAERLGVDLWEEHVPLVLQAMKELAAELGLDGSALKN
jgi:predicted hydrolase (HD superfamily)